MPGKRHVADVSRTNEQPKSEDRELRSQEARSTRRQFLVATSSIALGAAVPVSGAHTNSPPNDETPTRPSRSFSGDRTIQIAMPVGGIGAGCVCLNGYGGLQDFSIWNHPTTTALPEGFASSKAAFAILHVKGTPAITKLVEGPFPALKIYDQGLQGQGYRRGGFEGFPRFAKTEFRGEYPFGEVRLTDSTIPVEVTLRAWNPFIPLDDKNSGIPCAILEYALHNSSRNAVEYEFSYHLSHLASDCAKDEINSRNTVIPGRGVFLHNVEEPNSEAYGNACLIAISGAPRIKGMWLRSPGWEFDSLSALWREVSTGTFTINDGSN